MTSEPPFIKLRDKYHRASRSPRVVNEQIQLQELKNLLSHAETKSAWWRSHIASNFGEAKTASDIQSALADIPILTRTKIQEWGEKLWIISKDAKPGEFVRFKTSGSTGQPVFGVRYAPVNNVVEAALTLLEWQWFQRKTEFKILDFRVFGKFIDELEMTGYFAPSGYKGTRWERSTSDHSVSQLFEYIAEIQPDYIYSNGVTLRQLAQYGIEQNRVLPVSQFLSVADPIDSTTREMVAKTFNAMIVDRYSCKEIGMIALQCPVADHLHVPEPIVVVEIVDDAGNPVEGDDTGRVLLTALHSYATPLIRYELGDYAQWETEPCPLGITWRAIKKVQGRIRDTVRDENGEQRIVSLAGAVWLTWRKVRDQHIVRFDDRLIMFLELTEPLTGVEVDQLHSALAKVFYTDAPISLIPIPDMARLPYEKRRDFTKFENPSPVDLDPQKLFLELVQEAQNRISKNKIRQHEK